MKTILLLLYIFIIVMVYSLRINGQREYIIDFKLNFIYFMITLY